MAIKGLNNVNLNNQQKHIVKETIRGFELSGVGLEGKASERYKAIQEQLSILSNQFSKNVLQATNSWKKIVSLDDLKGYGKDELLKIKDGDQYVLNLQIPVYIDLMTYAENRSLREEVYLAYISRASDIGITPKKFDNQTVMNEILELRFEMAKLLGCLLYTSDAADE